MKDNAIKIRDMHLLKTNYKLLSEINKNDEKIAAMGKDMGRIIKKYEILKKKKLNKRDNKNDQRGYGMEDDSSEYEHGDTEEETIDDSEQSEKNTDDEMDEDDGSEYGHGDTDEESVDAYEQSVDMNDNEKNTRGPASEINARGPTSVTYGAPYYEIRTGAGIGGLLRARYRRGIGGLEV